jgi:hypothetical protein
LVADRSDTLPGRVQEISTFVGDASQQVRRSLGLCVFGPTARRGDDLGRFFGSVGATCVALRLSASDRRRSPFVDTPKGSEDRLELHPKRLTPVDRHHGDRRLSGHRHEAEAAQ